MSKTQLTGIPVNVYRWNLGDCTAGGVTALKNDFILVDPLKGTQHSPFKTKEGEVYLELVRRPLWTKTGASEYLHAEPRIDGEKLGRGLVGPMFGGNFVYTSDSRFPSDYPIPVHDRFETQETYNAMSR